MMSAKKLTSRQTDILGVVGGEGPITARGVNRHLPSGVPSARSILDALERKGFVSLNYTTPEAVSQNARAYEITHEGREALAAALDDWWKNEFPKHMERHAASVRRLRERAERQAAEQRG